MGGTVCVTGGENDGSVGQRRRYLAPTLLTATALILLAAPAPAKDRQEAPGRVDRQAEDESDQVAQARADDSQDGQITLPEIRVGGHHEPLEDHPGSAAVITQEEMESYQP